MFFFSSRRRHTRWPRDWSSDVCSSDLLHFRDDLLFNIQRVLDRQQVLMEILDTRNYMQQIHLAVEGLGQGLCHGAGASRVLWKIGWDQYSLQLCHLTSFV